MKNWRQFLREEDGPTATEYAVMLSIIIMAVVVTVKLIGGHVRDNFQNSSNEIANAVG